MTMFIFLNDPTLYQFYLRGGPFGHGLDSNEFLLKRAHVLGDLTKLMASIANYAFESLSTTQILHPWNEEVCGLAKCGFDYSLGINDDSHRLDCINISLPHVVVTPNQPNAMDNMHIHWPPSTS